jgi:hypothetical protein
LGVGGGRLAGVAFEPCGAEALLALRAAVIDAATSGTGSTSAWKWSPFDF